MRTPPLHATLLALALPLLLVACGEDSETGDGPVDEPPTAVGAGAGAQRFPEIVDATAAPTGDRVYDLEVTVSSPYDSHERYADGWRVLGPGGEVLGVMELLHDHASEQPFTRTQTGVEIPAGVERVTIEGRDLANGYGGETFELRLPGG